MKKTALLLALIMILTTLASCGGGGDESSSADSGVTSDVTSASGTEELVAEFETVVSIGKTYTYGNYSPDGKYPDSYTSELTDGVYADAVDYTNESFCGIAPNGGVIQVIIDLGDDSSRLYKFGASYLATTTAGLGSLGNSNVSASDDGENWKRLGVLITPKYEADTVQQAWFTSKTAVEARYIKFNLRASAAWLFLDELFVIADVKGSHAMTTYIENLSASYANAPLAEGDVVQPAGAPVDKSLNKYSASYGKIYNFSRTASKKYQGTGLALTDCIETGASYNTDNWIGWEGGDELTINLPLGITYNNISELEISMLCQPAIGIMLPYYVDFYVSEDNSNFTRVGRVYAPSDPAVRNFTFALSFEKCLTAKYVRFVCCETECKFFFCEEISVNYYSQKNESGTIYEDVILEQAGEKVYHSSGSSKETNLVKDMSFQISAATELNVSAERQYNSAITQKNLTDGAKVSTTDYTNSGWFRTHNGAARNVFFDLGYQASITGFEVGFLRNQPVGIGLPGSVSLYLSDDGESWYNVLRTAVPQTEEQLKVSRAAGELAKPVEARYIRVTFAVAGHVYLDEIEIFGTEKISSKTVSLSECDTVAETVGSYTQSSDELLGGVEDLILAYLSKGKVLDKDFFLPYAGYVDKDGKITDTLFDGFLFLPSGDYMPEGYAYNSKDKPAKAVDWKYLAEQMYVKDINYDALNQAVGEVKSALGLSDYKVKVYPTIPYISSAITSFGDIDGDGTDEDLSTVDGIRKVFEWYMDTVLESFEKANYDNLEFCGFYWFEEAISYTNDDYGVINACSDEANEREYQLFWIPYFEARGFSEWSSYGFEVACMQPNYAFNAEVPSNRIEQAVSDILQYGMGIEIEISTQSLSDMNYFRKYMNYLSYGIKYGYMNDSIHMYYAGVTDYYKASKSTAAMGRAVYDRTYEFIKGTLGSTAANASGGEFNAAADTVVTGKLFDNPDKLLRGKIAVSAKHGCVTLNDDGSFSYYPNKGFTGTDTFSYIINDYIVDSAPATVTVTIG